MKVSLAKVITDFGSVTEKNSSSYLKSRSSSIGIGVSKSFTFWLLSILFPQNWIKCHQENRKEKVISQLFGKTENSFIWSQFFHPHRLYEIIPEIHFNSVNIFFKQYLPTIRYWILCFYNNWKGTEIKPIRIDYRNTGIIGKQNKFLMPKSWEGQLFLSVLRL